MKRWDILETATYSSWYKTLDDDTKEDIYAKYNVLAEVGPRLGRPLVDTLEASGHKNMKELRVQSKGRPFRIFFAFDPTQNAVLLIGGNKAGDKRFYKKMISKADKLFDEYLEDLKNGKV